MDQFTENATPLGLYDPQFEHDACGIGAVVDIKGRKSHQTVSDALSIVERLEHRAGKDAEGKTGDGVGIMLQISHKFFSKVADELNISLGNEREYGVGMFFFPQNEHLRAQAMKLFELVTRKEGLEFLAWRRVPVDPDAVGQKARDCMPSIWQCFIKKPARVSKGIDFDRRLYIVRRVFEQASNGTYVPSLSSRTIVYKGMFLVHDLRLFYLDLQDEDYESAIGMVHSRFSTNTNPSWMRAHPNRFILHNGEINTIKGNTDAMLAREESIESPILQDDMNKILPIINTSGSDSAMLDNALEFMVMNGMDLPLAVMITIPEPWENNKNISQKKRDFYQYYATMLEPWDGPAAILFSDGDVVGAVLDRNGLRPSRYYITKDGRMILSSEVGVLPCAPDNILMKDRLRPGKMLLVDTVKGEVVDDEKLKEYYASREPYGEWIDRNLVRLKDLKIPNIKVPSYTGEELTRLQKVFGYKYEEIKELILPMARAGAEPSGAMGTDTPLAVLSDQHPPLFNYFKQRFAQVTNPPIDAIREKVVTSTSVYVGAHGNLLEDKPENCKVLKVQNPILTSTDLLKIKHMNVPGFKTATVSINYYKNTSLEKAIDRVFLEVDRAYKDGANIIILSDRDIDEYHVSIPSLLAVSAVSQYLIRTKKSTAMALILESAEPHEVHHFATLLGYGACAVNPYLAHDTIAQLIDEGLLDKDYYAAVDDYNKAVLNGIVKIASKMGISTIQSYQSSQIFEAVGISKDVIDKYFTGTVSRVGGIGLEDIQADVEAAHNAAFDPLGLDINMELADGGAHKFRSGKEEHFFTPQTIHLFQKACFTGDYKAFKDFTRTVDNMGAEGMHLRSLLDFSYDPNGGIPLEEVEPVSSIVKRFKAAAMSYGALSSEAHETIAIALNRLGGRSNTGEGGEPEERYQSESNSKIKQVASARFGVTSKYLVSAEEIQIKLAQGAKPGEGGNLPGAKVYPWIAKTRHSTTGVGLISPPPHHDIYSIEDLAELIYDLKNANRHANINVKLVSEAGVGTIAAGVAKGGAQVILVSGYDGGTGAAPRTSIKNAGLPWELGIAETHQTLILNGLRSRVRIESDSKLLSGRDVAISCMLGAEEFGFGTSLLMCEGCVMMRVCNLDTCPMGICTQNPELRKRFKGKPEYIINYLTFVAQELREYMAKLGVRTIDELVGRTDLLHVKPSAAGSRAAKMNLDCILHNPAIANSNVHFVPADTYDFHLENTLDMKVLMKKFKLGSKAPQSVRLEVSNTDRALGAIFGSEITRKYGSSLPDDVYTAECIGAGGQSFGAFIPKGLTLSLTGDCNDYMGKGLSGGKIIVRPPEGIGYKPEENIITGNVALYGATSGKAFVSGVAGERFCVRNSGATAVVEGVGDHGCEYMTGGTVVVLGQTGKNFAAGMTGGVAYVLDENWDFYQRVNKETVSLEPVEHKYDVAALKELIREHVEATGSPAARRSWTTSASTCPSSRKSSPTITTGCSGSSLPWRSAAWTANRHRSKHSTLCRRRSKEGWIMGKITGFMDYTRKTSTDVPPLERIENFNEFHVWLSREEQQTQAARCMDCGVPFCQAGMMIGGMASGCPLNNLIPEWNDLVYQGKWELALHRLRATNRFPEFTSRVCPALCEAACTCGDVTGSSVTVRENEHAIVETGYAKGWLHAAPPPARTGKSVAVIGSGPAGLSVAEYLNIRGHAVTVFERADRVGGLLMYGIPNMKLDKSVIERRIKIMQAEGVEFRTSMDVGGAVDAESILNSYDAVVLCCGAKKARDLNVPGRDANGVHFAVDYLTSVTKSLLDSKFADGRAIDAKGKNVLVIGGGDTGNDCQGTALRQGCTDLVALEMMPQPPKERAASNPWPEWPRVLKVDYGQTECMAKFGKDPRVYQTTVKEFLKDDAGNLTAAVISYLKPERDPETGRTNMVPTGEEFTYNCELAFIAAGFVGCESYVADAFGVSLTGRGCVDTDHFRTNVDKVFACGDMRRGQSLVVWGLREGRDCAAEVDRYLMGYTNL